MDPPEVDRRTCWVCFGTEDDDTSALWSRPCRCRGTTKWVHDSCLQRWFDEKQRGNPTVRVFCPQCNTEYTIDYPALGPLLLLIDSGDKMINKLSNVVAAGGVIGSLYWSAVTFGAISVMQVMGHKQGFEMLEKADPLFLLVGLPVIPFGLILAKMIRWEDYILNLWRKNSQSFWIFRKLFGDYDSENRPLRQPEDTSQNDLNSSTRILCGAFTLPTFATAFGNYLFPKVESPLKRVILGGATFILVKGVIQIYYRQQQYLRLARRQIKDFVEPISKPSDDRPTSL
ncbi:E3 ubiquitin-protein ligase MARCHF5 isoform X2 [Hydra vulgaris]|uniref:E3 ubiquitin-protein ligase MARCHF5 n=1 Tax=Hydra vulgaris TaxID=6087 RepID=A0ABM4BH95_HYDVU